MVLQYISDNQGHTKAVQLQIPIDEWNRLKERYPELASESEEMAKNIPEWHTELGKLEIDKLKSGQSGVELWDIARESFRF